jgi:hypothetical protein
MHEYKSRQVMSGFRNASAGIGPAPSKKKNCQDLQFPDQICSAENSRTI